jgi:hypothetical protein
LIFIAKKTNDLFNQNCHLQCTLHSTKYTLSLPQIQLTDSIRIVIHTLLLTSNKYILSWPFYNQLHNLIFVLTLCSLDITGTLFVSGPYNWFHLLPFLNLHQFRCKERQYLCGLDKITDPFNSAKYINFWEISFLFNISTVILMYSTKMDYKKYSIITSITTIKIHFHLQ